MGRHNGKRVRNDMVADDDACPTAKRLGPKAS